MLLDFVGTVILTAVMVVNVNAVISAMPVERSWRLALALIVGLWIGLQVALTGAGVYSMDVPWIGLGVAVPLVAAVVAFRSRRLRGALLAVPTPLLIGLNFSRVFGAFFLLLAAGGRLAGPFPYSAGWGDIAVGLIALPLAIAAARGTASRGAIVAWNAFAALDLVAAIGLGLFSARGSPLHLIDAGVGSAAVASLPWALIPTVLVPFYLIVHGVIFLQQREMTARRLPASGAA